MKGVGFRVQVLGCRVKVSGYGVWNLGLSREFALGCGVRNSHGARPVYQNLLDDSVDSDQ